jgi:hypothetical protein
VFIEARGQSVLAHQCVEERMARDNTAGVARPTLELFNQFLANATVVTNEFDRLTNRLPQLISGGAALLPDQVFGCVRTSREAIRTEVGQRTVSGPP